MLSSAPGAVIPSFSAQLTFFFCSALTFTVDRFFEAFDFDCFLGVVLGLDFGVVLGLDFEVVLGFVLGLALGLVLGRDLGGIWSKGNKKS